MNLDSPDDIRAAIEVLRGMLPAGPPPGDELGIGETQRKILDALRAAGAGVPMTNWELRRALGLTIDDGNLSNSLHGLQMRKLVEKVQRGVWAAL